MISDKKYLYYRRAVLFIGMTSLAVFTSCRERYYSAFEEQDTGYLVVNGFINTGQTPTVIELSRSIKLNDDPAQKPVAGATVQIESDAGDRIALQEVEAGMYKLENGLLKQENKHRLYINIQGKEYVSVYLSAHKTPAIDSISWEKGRDGVQLYVQADAEAGDEQYFQWKYNETWEYRAAIPPTIKYIYNSTGKITGVAFDDAVDKPGVTCWQNDRSRNILVGSTEKLSRNIVYQPVCFIPYGSQKLNAVYSILLKQYSISKAAYNFLLQMKKNTEQLGSVFDPQPAQLLGNITCLSNPDEKVIGYVDVTQEKNKRFFLNNFDVGGWPYTPPSGCQTVIVRNNSDSIANMAAGLVPAIPQDVILLPPPVYVEIVTFVATQPSCVDCRLNGGTDVKPSFWP